MNNDNNSKHSNKKMSIQKPKSSSIVFITLTVLCIGFALACYQYYSYLQDTFRTESKSYLHEVSRKIGDNLNRIFEDNFAVLHTMAASLEEHQYTQISHLQQSLRNQQQFWDFENIFLVDETGMSYDINDQAVFLTLDETTRKSILAGNDTISPTQIINNKEYIVFGIPLNNFYVDGIKIVALAAGYDSSSFDQALSMNAFNEQAYSQIITKTGTMITRPSSQYAIKSGYNILSTIKNAKIDSNSDLSETMKDIMADRAGQLGFELNGEHRYMIYTPIQPEEWYLLTFVPAQAINTKSDIVLLATIRVCGLLVIIFSALVGTIYYIFRKNKRKLEQIAYVDSVTGGHTIDRFYEFARQTLNTNLHQSYVMVYSNIEKFKVLNEQFGREVCDEILRFYSQCISTYLVNDECIGRISADNFCMLLEYRDEKHLVQRLSSWRAEAEKTIMSENTTWELPATEFGIYLITDRTIPFTQMIDRAKLSLRSRTWAVDTRLHYAFYDDKVRHQLFREKQLEDQMQSALKNNEFEIYLQPKHHLPDESILGAEALVRWSKSSEGMIYPDEFIPLFEKNGFVVELDLWVFEQVCKLIESWISKSITPIKVSVNCSRVHFRDPDFLIPYIQLADQYQIDRSLIEIELTESIVFENTEELIMIINEIKEAGFGCSMDDFGSGYSALNVIQRIPVDTIKLDRIFFYGNLLDPKKTEAVIKSIVSMAKALSMETVAEGVEQRSQVEMLKLAGCDYIQGYVFARPVPVIEFEEMLNSVR